MTQWNGAGDEEELTVGDKPLVHALEEAVDVLRVEEVRHTRRVDGAKGVRREVAVERHEALLDVQPLAVVVGQILSLGDVVQRVLVDLVGDDRRAPLQRSHRRLAKRRPNVEDGRGALGGKLNKGLRRAKKPLGRKPKFEIVRIRPSGAGSGSWTSGILDRSNEPTFVPNCAMTIRVFPRLNNLTASQIFRQPPRKRSFVPSLFHFENEKLVQFEFSVQPLELFLNFLNRNGRFFHNHKSHEFGIRRKKNKTITCHEKPAIHIKTPHSSAEKALYGCRFLKNGARTLKCGFCD